MPVCVVVPWRAGCPYRERAWEWVAGRYADRHPDWRVLRAPGQSGGAWIKAQTVSPAIEATDAQIVVVADADCWTEGLTEAVEQIEAGAAWAIPHLLVHRLTDTATMGLLAGRPAGECEQPPYEGIPGGGLVVATRDVLRSVPLDRRFVGWGQEDESWGHALTVLLGPPWRGTADLLHLWHPPQERADRVRGNQDGWRLRRRYLKARRDPALMRALVEEGRHVTDRAAQPALHADPPGALR